MPSNDLQLKLIIAILTLCFTGIFGLGGYLAKKLIDDIANKLDRLVQRQDEHAEAIIQIRVQQKEHQMDIRFLKEKMDNSNKK